MIHYYKSGDPEDYFMSEDDDWYYVDTEGDPIPIETKNLPNDLLEIEWKDMRHDKIDIEFVTTLKGNESIGDFCGPGLYSNKIQKIYWNYDFKNILDYFKDEDRTNNSWGLEVTMHRYGKIEIKTYLNNNFEDIAERHETDVPFDRMKNFFNEIDVMQNNTGIGGMIADDHGGETKIFYENGKTVCLPRGVETVERIEIHGYVKDFLEKTGIKTEYNN